MRGRGSGRERNLDHADRVGRVGRADDQKQVDLLRVAHLDVVDRLRPVDERDVLRGFAARPDDLFVPLVADQQDVVVVLGEAAHLVVHLRHERARGVDGLQVARRRLLVDFGGDAVRGEDHDRALGHLVVLLDEYRAALLERLDDVQVVDDLLADVHRRAVVLQRVLDGLHRAVDAGTVAAGFGEQYPLLSAVHAPDGTDVAFRAGWTHAVTGSGTRARRPGGRRRRGGAPATRPRTGAADAGRQQRPAAVDARPAALRPA